MFRLTTPDFEEWGERLFSTWDGNRVLVPIGRARGDWRVQVLDVDDVRLSRGVDGSGGIYRGHFVDRLIIYAPLSPIGVTRINGETIGDQSIARLVSGHALHWRTFAPAAWVAINFRIEDLLASLDEQRSIASRDALARSHSIAVTRPERACLLSLVRRAFSADARGDLAAHALPARRALRRQLVEAGARFLAHDVPQSRTVGRPLVCREAVISRSIDYIEAFVDQNISIIDLCRATGVSERTLRTIFLEQFGVTPNRYLMLARLVMIRKAFATAAPDETVSMICTRYGVWDFGRFSARYRHAFGELPSRDLAIRRGRSLTSTVGRMLD